MGTAPLIFISYATVDLGLTAVIKNFLRDAGLSTEDCFVSSLDGAIQYGGNDLEEMYQAMESSKIFIEVITPTFLTRPRCLQEVGFMTARKRLADRDELPSQRWIKILPMVVPPLTHEDISETLDRAQAPTLESPEAIHAFTDELFRCLLRDDRRLSPGQWHTADR
jgi:hypothetical protein